MRRTSILISILGIAIAVAATSPAVAQTDPVPSSAPAPAPDTAPPVAAPPVAPIPTPTPPPPPAPVAPPIQPQINAQLASLRRDVGRADGQVQQLSTARDALASAIQTLEARLTELRAQITAHQDAARAAARAISAARRQMTLAAVATYKGDQSVSNFTDVSPTHYMETARRDTLSDRYIGEQRHRIKVERRTRAKERQVAQQLSTTRDQVEVEKQHTTDTLSHTELAISGAQRDALGLRLTQGMWLTIKDGWGTEIRSTSVLSAGQLAEWLQRQRTNYRAKVPIADLANLYVSEGNSEGIRADLAFAQAVLETGSFGSADTAEHNNFAGIGHCDSCPSGIHFENPQIGVRAQMQLLLSYADPTASVATLHNPPVLPGYGALSIHGSVKTWGALTGTWATAPDYADKVLGVYVKMLCWATRRC